MDIEWLGLPDASYLARMAIRLGSAAVLGGLVGAQREIQGKAAGLRTHMTVSLAAATFVLVGIEAGDGTNNLGTVIQGIAAGVGFLGAGTILKKSSDEDIQGLTTAATIWLTAAIGVAAGLGREATALLSTLLAVAVLAALPWLANRVLPPPPPAPDADKK